MLSRNKLDHIAIGASSLDAGAEFVKARLGIDIPIGGEHELMGTHNRLMSLGGGPGDERYLELIAINSEVDKPARPRWFGLDSDVQQALLSKRPRPISWVMRVNDVEWTLSYARDAGIDLGEPLEMTRGALHWIIAVREDGLLPEEGTLPVVIQWPDGPHPANSMQDFGFRLHTIRLSHPQPQELAKKLRVLEADHLVKIESTPSDTPGMECELVNETGELFRL